MADSFPFELVSPERSLFAGAVESVVVPGSEGEMTILARHAPLMTALRPGVVVVQETGAAPRRLFVQGGFCDVNESGLTILAETAMPVEEIEAHHVETRMREAEDEHRAADTDDARARAGAKIEIAREMMAVVRN